MTRQYPTELWALDAEELRGLGLSRDERGRIRTAERLYVCAVSGRVHDIRLYSVADRQGGRWVRIWVDRREFIQAGGETGGGFLAEIPDLIARIITKAI